MFEIPCCVRSAVILLLLVTLAAAQESDGQRRIGLEQVENRPRKWALLIGVDDYVKVKKLRFCGRDVKALKECLENLGFDSEHTYLLHDKTGAAELRPTSANIRRVIEELFERMRPGDEVVIAFSGHGVHIDGRSYFCPTDADLKNPKTLLSLERLYDLLKRSPASSKVLLVDACRNDPRPAGLKTFVPHDTISFSKQLFGLRGKDICVLSSCAEGQVSVEDPILRHGVFMNFILSGLRGAADVDGNRRVSLTELYSYAEGRTAAFVHKSRNKVQTPEAKLIGNFEFAEHRRSSEPRSLHAFLFSDVDDQTIGPACAADLESWQNVLAKRVDTKRVRVYSLPMQGLLALNDYIRRANPAPNDAILIVVSGRGYRDSNGEHVLELGAGKSIGRSDVLATAARWNAPLTALITDASAVTKTGLTINNQLTDLEFASQLGAFKAVEPTRRNSTTSSTMNGLFFESNGVVDINSCETNQDCVKNSTGSLFLQTLADGFNSDKSLNDKMQGWDATLTAVGLRSGFEFRELAPEGRLIHFPDGKRILQETQTVARIQLDITPRLNDPQPGPRDNARAKKRRVKMVLEGVIRTGRVKGPATVELEFTSPSEFDAVIRYLTSGTKLRLLSFKGKTQGDGFVGRGMVGRKNTRLAGTVSVPQKELKGLFTYEKDGGEFEFTKVTNDAFRVGDKVYDPKDLRVR